MQRVWRGFSAQKKYVAQREKISTVQSLLRSVHVRSVVVARMKKAATVLGRNARRMLSNIDLERKQAAAIELQRVWRGFYDRKQLRIAHDRTTMLQCLYRKRVATRRAGELRSAAQEQAQAQYEKEMDNMAARRDRATVVAQRMARYVSAPSCLLCCSLGSFSLPQWFRPALPPAQTQQECS